LLSSARCAAKRARVESDFRFHVTKSHAKFLTETHTADHEKKRGVSSSLRFGDNNVY
jgi:hypothetical protein